MKIIRYGITISLMEEADIEMVRLWRNDPVVASRYEFRDYITPEMQEEWFRRVDNIHNLYGIIEYEGHKAGVVNLKNIDWDRLDGEGGIFIPDPKDHETPLPSIVTFLTTELMVDLFGWKSARAHVLSDQMANQGFIRQLGYELLPGQEEVYNQEYLLNRERFARKAPKIRKAIVALTGREEPLRILFEKKREAHATDAFLEQILIRTIPSARQEDTPEGRVYLIH